MGATIKSTGDRISNGNLLPTFVQGAYNLGAVYESKLIVTTAFHPGEILNNGAGAAGEDGWLIMPDKTPLAAAIAELNLELIAGASTDYTIGDEVLGVTFHLNPGAVCRNVSMVDPDTADQLANSPLHTNSGTAGSLIVHKEEALIDSDTADGEAFTTDAVIGDEAATIAPRTPMRAKIFKTDPSAAYLTIAYICLA